LMDIDNSIATLCGSRETLGVIVEQATAYVRAHVEKAPFGLRVPLEYIFLTETVKNAEGIFNAIRITVEQYLRDKSAVRVSAPAYHLFIFPVSCWL
jgi:hypothetical protein